MSAGWRFIAGAVCSNCGKTDTVQMNLDDKTTYCVECQHRGTPNEDGGNNPEPQQTINWKDGG